MLEGKALGGATAAKTKVHTRGGPGRRPALARARQGRRISCDGDSLLMFEHLRIASAGHHLD